MEQNSPALSPVHFFQVISAFHVSAALKTAIDLKLFTYAADGNSTAGDLAVACGTAERGMRILADTMTVVGFLTKMGQHYTLTPEASMFLVESSPAYVGAAAEFLHHSTQKRGFDDLTNAVRQEAEQPLKKMVHSIPSRQCGPPLREAWLE
ncbi:MAG: methyltransferase dimerization domain-containing protein [Acidobacteriota bacterium]